MQIWKVRETLQSLASKPQQVLPEELVLPRSWINDSRWHVNYFNTKNWYKVKLQHCEAGILHSYTATPRVTMTNETSSNKFSVITWSDWLWVQIFSLTPSIAKRNMKDALTSINALYLIVLWFAGFTMRCIVNPTKVRASSKIFQWAIVWNRSTTNRNSLAVRDKSRMNPLSLFRSWLLCVCERTSGESSRGGPSIASNYQNGPMIQTNRWNAHRIWINKIYPNSPFVSLSWQKQPFQSDGCYGLHQNRGQVQVVHSFLHDFCFFFFFICLNSRSRWSMQLV